MDETDTAFREADTTDPEVAKAVSEAGLYIKSRAGTYLKVLLNSMGLFDNNVKTDAQPEG